MVQIFLSLAGLVVAWVLLASGCLLLVFRSSLFRLWREPVLKVPVLIIESDDWGAGSLDQAAALERLRCQLMGYRDSENNPPVITLALVLAGPDHEAMAAQPGVDTPSPSPFELPHELRSCTVPPKGEGSAPGSFAANSAGACAREYHRKTLAEPAYKPLLEQLRGGSAEGVFALQLHGMEHYWPAALMAAATHNAELVAWLERSDAPTEELPPSLQSRWIDARTLPSMPIDPARQRQAVVEEVALYRELFGAVPAVVVPPTFVWNQALEQAWGAEGVRVVVTPGRRLVARDGAGGLVADRQWLLADEAGAGGVHYQVRDAYFEPAWGQDAERGLKALAERSHLGRATLLETHRFNFMQQAESSHRELDRLLREALVRFPNLRFISTQDLAEAMRVRAPELLETRLRQRLQIWCRRLDTLPGFRCLSLISGFALVTACFKREPAPETLALEIGGGR